MNAPNIVSIYESVAELTRQMLIATQQQDWEQLKTLEDCCAEYVEQLKIYEQLNPEPVSGEEYQRKLGSIKQLLADDREIRNLMTPWMVKLDNLYYPKRSEPH